MSALQSDRDFLTRAILLIGGSTVVLTASFVGLLAVISGEAEGIGSRVPYYLVVLGIAFVGTIVLLEEHGTESRVIIVTAAVISLLAFVATSLTAEGALFAYRFPEEVFVSQLVYYFVAAALIGTGIGYWAIQHWREFTRQTNRPGSGL